MLFFQINKKAGISNIDRLADCISTAFLYTPAKGGTVGDPKLELEVLTLNINEGHNKELMEQCQTLKEYAQYVNYVRRYAKDFELNEAVKLAVNECIHDNILSDFLRVNKAEVISMSIFEYDKELEERKLRKAEYEAGVADGINTATENIKREDALSLVDLGLSVEQITLGNIYFESYCIQQLDSFPVFFWLFPVLCSFFFLCDKVFSFILLHRKGRCFKFNKFNANYFYLFSYNFCNMKKMYENR